MRTTVLIPLHASAPWLPVVAGNIERLAPHARLLVSDATGVDDTLGRLRERFFDLTDIEWVGPRPLRSGWVAHCNDLVHRAATEFVMWMPHDDEIDADWVTLGEGALDATPGAVLALGWLHSLEGEDRATDDRRPPARAPLHTHVPFCDIEPETRALAAVEECLHGNTARLGAAFRGVYRRETAVPLPDTGPDGAWADILWAIGMLTVGAFTPTDASYRKRWHAGNTHGDWADPRKEDSFRREVLPHALGRLAPEVREVVLATSWSNEATRTADQLAQLRRRLRSAQAAADAVRRAFEASASWRLTAPGRAAARIARRSGPRPLD